MVVHSSYESNYENTITIYHMNGIYTTMVNGKPMYVYLNNAYRNEYLTKSEAISVGEENYEDLYLFSKTKLNPKYINGVTPNSEKYITIYALSGKEKVNGWNRVNPENISKDEMVATTIDLGEFLLKGVDLSAYQYNKLGYAYVDFNKDGISNQLMYIGNNKYNTMMLKPDAINYASKNYKNYYILRKKVINPENKKGFYVYALSDKSKVDGWTKINKKDLPKDAVVASNTDYMNVLVDMLFKPYCEEVIYNYIDPTFACNFMLKDEALNYAYNNYKSFCILTKKIVNPNNVNEIIDIYAFSTIPFVEGWSIIGNDNVPSNAVIFLTMTDAYVYESDLNNNFSRTLK